MISTSDELGLWCAPCICHLLNKIFEKFIKCPNKELAPFFTIVAYLERPTKYSIFVKKRKIKKVLSFINVRWTFFCQIILCSS